MPSQTITIKWLMWIGKFILTMLIFFLLLSDATATTHWRKLSQGLDYQDINRGYNIIPWSHIHVFRINLKYNQLSLVIAKDLAVRQASIDEYTKYSNSLIAINGGFFDQNYQPLGLRISNKQQQNPLKRISWWGIFYIKNNKAYLSNSRYSSIEQFNQDKQIQFAVQSGPKLLVNGQIYPLKPGRTERSALGITKNGNVIILITDNAPLSTEELAQLMKEPPLNCVNALNLDGGRSSQLRAHINSFKLNVYGLSNISDAIIVKAKNSMIE